MIVTVFMRFLLGLYKQIIQNYAIHLWYEQNVCFVVDVQLLGSGNGSFSIV